MGLIIKDKIAQLKKGYPTVSDKYNVQGGVAMDEIAFGDLVAYGETTGHYKKYVGDDGQTIAGIALSTNVKLMTTWPADDSVEQSYVKGDAMSLMLDGFVAVEVLADNATVAKIVEGAAVNVTDDGEFATADKGGEELDRTIFTGIYEAASYDKDGNVASYLAEIRYNM